MFLIKFIDYHDDIAKLYGIFKTIILDRDVWFMSSFEKTFWHIISIKL